MAFQVSSEEKNLKPSQTERRWNPLQIFFEDARNVLKPDKLGWEIAQIAFPAALALTADPIASLVDTAFVGQIGPVELAAVGVSIAIFNQVSKVFNFPLVSVTTTLVAEEDATSEMEIRDRDIEESIKDITTSGEKDALISSIDGINMMENASKDNTFLGSTMTELSNEKRLLPSISSALLIGGALGIIEACILILGAKPILNIMGVNSFSIQFLYFFLDLESAVQPLLMFYPSILSHLFFYGICISGLYCCHLESLTCNLIAFSKVMGMLLGVFLAAVLGGSLRMLSKLFTNDERVLALMHIGIPFVAATQPINSLAFVFDGINFGASDFTYAAYSMVSVSVISILCLLVLSPLWGFIGVWIGLTILMTLRMFAGVWRIGTATGPWSFLRR